MKLKLALATLYCVAKNHHVHGLRTQYGGFTAVRLLDSTEYVFLENNSFTPFCIAKTGATSVGFEACDYQGEPSNQLWRFSSEGKVHSKEDDTLCWIANDGVSVGDGEISLTACDSTDSTLAKFDTDLNLFEDQIKVDTPSGDDEQTLCVTSQSVDDNFDPLDQKIFVDGCDIGDRWLWISNFSSGSRNYIAYVDVGDNGCITPRGGATYAGNALMLGSCNADDPPMHAQWYKDNDGLIHARTDFNMCWQAGHGESLGDGSKLRLYPCDDSNDLQKFTGPTSDPGFTLQSRDDLCIVYRGVNANVNFDPIIFKSCDRIGSRAKQWTGVSGD